MEVKLKIINEYGVHARPAARMAQMGRRYNSQITYIAKGVTADGKNIIPIINMGLVYGDDVIIKAEGEDEQAAIEALTELINDRFGEHQ